MKIAVTGGAGYIGSITTKELINNGYQVVVIDNLEKGHQQAIDKRAIFELADVGDKERTAEIFKEHKINAVIDFAAYIAVGESMEEPKKYFHNNVENFVNLLDSMKKNDVSLIIKSSTAAVYGIPEKETDLPLKESYMTTYKPKKSSLSGGKWKNRDVLSDDFLGEFLDYYHQIFIKRPELALKEDEITKLKIPTSIYGLTKLLDEIIMNKYDNVSGLKGIVLRYFNVAGADPSGNLGQDNDNPTHIFANAIFQALGKKDELTVFGQDYNTKDGTGVRDYIHVNDLATGHVKALEYLLREQKSDTINLGTGQGYSVIDVIKAVEEASGRNIKYRFGEKRSGDVPILLADPTKAKEILKWEAKYSLIDMAKTAWKWHSSHPRGYEN